MFKPFICFFLTSSVWQDLISIFSRWHQTVLWFRTLGLLVKLGWVWLWHLNAPELLGSLWSNFCLFVKQRSKCITGFFWGPIQQCRENSVHIQRVNNRDETEDPGITMCWSKVTVSEGKGKGGGTSNSLKTLSQGGEGITSNVYVHVTISVCLWSAWDACMYIPGELKLVG